MLVVARAYLIRSCDGSTAILSFRGTEPVNLVNWLGNADTLGKTIYGGCVHHGFFTNVEALWDYIDTAVDTAITGKQPAARGCTVVLTPGPVPTGPQRSELRPLQHLYITGHSLGGALAVLAAAK